MKRYTDEQLINAISQSKSFSQVLILLGRAPMGGNYAIVKKRTKKLNADTSHFTGMSWNKGKKFGPKRPLSDYLSNKYPIASHKLKLRLIAAGVFKAICFVCGLTEWLGQPIPLELDHKDGNHENNALENLRLLCPNCHAQTDNYRSKNRA